jgi:hypothetical protein
MRTQTLGEIESILPDAADSVGRHKDMEAGAIFY